MATKRQQLVDLKRLYTNFRVNIDTPWFQKPTFDEVDAFVTYGKDSGRHSSDRKVIYGNVQPLSRVKLGQ